MKRKSARHRSRQHRPRVKRSYVRHAVPVIVWLVAVAAVAALFQRRSQRFELVGLAQGKVHAIAATCTGRLQSVPVGLFDRVGNGQVVAVLDTVLDNENLGTELATAAAQIEHLMAQLVPTQERILTEAANLEARRVSDRRAFSVNVETTRLRILQLKVLIETDRIRLDDLAIEVQVANELLARDTIAPYELDKAKAQYETLAKTIQENQKLLAQAASDLEQARRRRDEFGEQRLKHPSVDSALEVIRKAIHIEEKRVEELRARRVALELTSPFDGVVSQIQHWPGEAVQANETILMIAELKSNEIVAYARENMAGRIREGMTVELVKDGDQAQIAKSQVVAVGPSVVQLPQRLWPNPNMPQWGRPFVIKAPPEMMLVAGQVVGVRGF